MDEWMKKMGEVYTYNWILYSHKKRGFPAIYDKMDGSWEHYAKCDKEDVCCTMS